MGVLTDRAIQGWIRAGEHFETRGDGDGLCLSYRKSFAVPVWKFRYQLAGVARTMTLGSYRTLSLADARKIAKEYRARVALGYDPAAEKQDRKREVVRSVEAAKTAWTVSRLMDDYFTRVVLVKRKNPDIIKARMDRDIRPHIGKLLVEEVRPLHIDDMLQAIVKRGAPTMANEALRWVKRLFNFAMKRHLIDANPAAAFDLSDAGGEEKARNRALSRDELRILFEAMRNTNGVGIQNYLAIKLLLLLAVRKQELTTAKVSEFDINAGVWHLPGERTKTGKPITIPLSPIALDAVKQLIAFGCGSAYLLPARNAGVRMAPHISDATLNTALSKAKRRMDIPAFTIHDFRRTARTQLSALRVPPHIAERCLNHKIGGVVGVYDHYDYLPERREALNQWAEVVDACERGEEWQQDDTVVPIRRYS